MFNFKTALPESENVPSSAIRDVLAFLDKKKLPMHSLLIMRNDRLIFEKYYAPYKRETLHRLFSISKTCTALAISLLKDDGKINYDASITDYFPEYTSADTHPWIKETTIRNMLEMRTCHASTTYKVDMKSDWVKSFFVVPPTHKPGTVFHYDTSAAHVLCALVEKTTHMPMLDYLKQRVLNYMDFSEDSYMLKDPFGISIGGSGLMATPMDFMKILYLIENRGTIVCSDGVTRTLLSKEFLDRATSNISDSLMNAPIPGESQGYGMQIWQNEKGGYTLYGMGGQLGISIPSKNLLIITTADTQGMQGGNQLIYDAVYDILLPAIEAENTAADDGSDYDALLKYAKTLKIAPPRLPDGYLCSAPLFDKKGPRETICNTAFARYDYALSENAQNFEKLTVSLSRDGASFLTFASKASEEDFTISFGINRMQEGVFAVYNNEYTAGACWLRDNVLYIRVHLIGESVGSVRIELYFDSTDIVVYMRKIEETYFKEFDGHLYGRLISSNT